MSTQNQTKPNFLKTNFHYILTGIFILLLMNTCSNFTGRSTIQRSVDEKLDKLELKLEQEMLTKKEFTNQLELFFRAEEMSDKNKIPFEEQLGRLRMESN